MINIQKSYLVYFSPNQSILSSLVHFGSIWSILVLQGPFYSIYFSPLRSTLAIFSPFHFSSIRFTFVLFGPFCQLRSYSIDTGPIPSTMVLFSTLWSYSILFVPIWSIGPFGPDLSICSYSVHFGPPCSHSVLFYPFSLFGPFVSTSVHFMHLHIRKGYVWVETTYSKSIIYIYIYIYIFISNS